MYMLVRSLKMEDRASVGRKEGQGLGTSSPMQLCSGVFCGTDNFKCEPGLSRL